MTDSKIPIAGSLEATIIRACALHKPGKCELDCPARNVEPLGEIASFGPRPKDWLERIASLWRKESR